MTCPIPAFCPVVYHKRFLIWWGISLYLFQLGSRRQLDFDLDARGTQVLDNLNRLAQTQQETRPVHDTLDHFLGHTGAAPYAGLRTLMLRRLIRMRCLDAARLQGRFVVVLDATGHLAFRGGIARIVWSTVTKPTPPTCIRSWKPNCSGRPV